VTGKRVFLCKSIGFPIPYATQFTSPSKIESWGGHPIVVPQADPNGLFSPSNAEGTWILCLNPNNSKDIEPVYSEPKVITALWPLK
jgi:hypothetical protein